MASASTSSIPGNVSVPTPARAIVAPLSLWESFMCGGIAGCAAVTVCEWRGLA